MDNIINYIIYATGTLAIYLAILFIVIGGLILLIKWIRRHK